MAKKKNGFLNFCFSCMPGAGQMYQGYLKRGVSIMGLFFAEVFVAMFFGMDELMLGLPIIWFFGFFDSLHRNSLSDQERAPIKDKYLFIDDKDLLGISLQKYRIPVAGVLIFFGGYGIIRCVMNALVTSGIVNIGWEIRDAVYDYIPKIVVSVIIIGIGVYLIKGKKQEIDDIDMGYIQKNDDDNK